MADVGQVRDEERDAQAEARRLAALAQIRQFPDPALRMRAREVESFDGDLKRLVDRMTRLMGEAYGIGLAAPQIGVLQRVFVFQRDEDDIAAVVNPVVVARSEEAEIDEEGCLSIQDVRVPVERHVEVAVEGRDPEGGELRLEVAALQARVVQHEIDHLDGTLILDRTDEEHRRAALAALRPRPVLSRM